MSATQRDIKATIELLRLKQTGSARDYSIKFLELSSRVTNEIYLAVRFFLALKEEIQTALCKDRELPATFEEIMRKATIINSYCYAYGTSGYIAKNCRTEQ